MVWTIKVSEFAEKQFKKLDKPVANMIVKYLRERIAGKGDPTRFGKALTNDKSGIWRYRVGDYRILCEIKNHELIVLVLRVGHRKQIYDE